ncbi:MAG: hypothetical protein K0S65_1139 [Labilithrix sp.]|nr:hypothetical protein [Labilithrix sp.]
MMPSRPVHQGPTIPASLLVGRWFGRTSRTLADMEPGRGRRFVVFLALALGVSGCERGCLSRWLGDRGVGGNSPEGSGGEAPGRALDLSGVDCSDGLLRCIDGRVEASRAAHLRCDPSKKGESACTCPWETFTRCTSGCASEGLEAIGAASDAGAAQLCRPDEPVARPVLPGDAVAIDVCVNEGVTCVDGIIRFCEAHGQPARPIAACLNGCQSHVGIDFAQLAPADPGARTNPDGVVSILCRRDHAERR